MAVKSILRMLESEHLRTWGVILLLFGVFVLILSDGKIPEQASLVEISGELRSLEKTTSKGGGLGSVRFSLSTDPRHFRYHSSAGSIDEVWGALNRAGKTRIGVLIDPADAHSPPGDDRHFYAVLEIRIARQTIRSYSEVAQSLSSNNFTGEVFGYGVAAIGAVLLAAAFFMRR